VLARFRYEPDCMVRGILRELVSTGLVDRNGRGASAELSATVEIEMTPTSGQSKEDANAALAWVQVYRRGPIGFEPLAKITQLPHDELNDALNKLLGDRRIERDSCFNYSAPSCVPRVGEQASWQASIFDHYRALVDAIIIKLNVGRTQTQMRDKVGGTTLSFDVWPEHPFASEIFGLLARFRSEAIPLWEEVAKHNQKNHTPPDGVSKVTFYFGQAVSDQEASPP